MSSTGICPLKILFKDVEKGVKMREPSTSSKANVPRKKKIKEVCQITISFCPKQAVFIPCTEAIFQKVGTIQLDDRH